MKILSGSGRHRRVLDTLRQVDASIRDPRAIREVLARSARLAFGEVHRRSSKHLTSLMTPMTLEVAVLPENP